MDKKFTVGTLQQDIRTQMEVSGEILDIARALQKLAESADDNSKEIIDATIRRLAGVGNRIVENAKDVGGAMVAANRAR